MRTKNKIKNTCPPLPPSSSRLIFNPDYFFDLTFLSGAGEQGSVTLNLSHSFLMLFPCSSLYPGVPPTGHHPSPTDPTGSSSRTAPTPVHSSECSSAGMGCSSMGPTQLPIQAAHCILVLSISCSP